MNEPRSRLIVALDVPQRAAALEAVDLLADLAGCFKLGLEIFVREGPRLVEDLRNRNVNVFLDLKLHDIPNQVAGAVRSACRLGVQMLTLHAAGGAKMLEAARQAAEDSGNPPLLLAVTALTSLGPSEVAGLGIPETMSVWVERLSSLASAAGLRGLVASALELPNLRRRFGPDVKLVVPGIRPAGTASEDQARVAGPAEAIRAGADFLVVGRPILQAPDPRQAAERIVAEIAGAMDNSRRPASPGTMRNLV
jgi:orotidine-5'-phosphate decarboxylase